MEQGSTKLGKMNYIERLRKEAQDKKSILCVGLDPVLERIPVKEKNTEKKITQFYLTILKSMVASKAPVSLIKPNYAYFAQYGFPGLRALKKIIDMYKKNYIVILDAKRGDIGTTAHAYAKEVFDFWQAEAVTVNPYLGRDGLEPFFDYCKKGKGVYVLVRTSNPGASEFQNLPVGNEMLYRKVARSLVSWNVLGVGAVVGGTSINELQELTLYFNSQRSPIPMLIPGVGGQGGSAREVGTVLRKLRDRAIHRVNASSSINYAWEQSNTKDYADAAIKAIVKLNKEINFVMR